MDDRNLRKAYSSILKGRSDFILSGSLLYIRHFDIFSQVDVDSVYSNNYKLALEKKLPTEQEKLEFLKKEGSWTDRDDQIIFNCERTIKSFDANISKLTSPSQARNLRQQQKTEQEALNKKLAQKNEVLGLTCESFAAKRTNDYYIFQSLYKDPELKVKYYDKEEFDYLSDMELQKIIISYNETMKNCTGDGIKLIAIAPFFQNTFSLAESVYEFFGKPVSQLTFVQVELAMYGRYFKRIFEENPNLPHRLKTNPEEISDFVTVQNNVKQILENSKGGAVGFANMTVEDMKDLRLENHADNTHELLKKSGKTRLTAEDLYRMNK